MFKSCLYNRLGLPHNRCYITAQHIRKAVTLFPFHVPGGYNQSILPRVRKQQTVDNSPEEHIVQQILSPALSVFHIYLISNLF